MSIRNWTRGDWLGFGKFLLRGLPAMLADMALTMLCWAVVGFFLGTPETMSRIGWAFSLGIIMGYLIDERRRRIMAEQAPREDFDVRWDCPNCKAEFIGERKRPMGKMPRGIQPPTLRIVQKESREQN